MDIDQIGDPTKINRFTIKDIQSEILFIAKYFNE